MSDVGSLGPDEGSVLLGKARALEKTKSAVTDTYRAKGVDITAAEIASVSTLLLQLGSVDVAEVFSPPRFTDAAPSLGLKPGFAVDLATGWDLKNKLDKEAFFQKLEQDDPYLLTGSPPCDAFSVLRHIGKNKRTAQEEADKLAGGREHLQTAVKAYRSQMTRGRLFLHEHPKSAASWKEPEIEALRAEDGIYYVSGPMCRWELMPDHSQEPVGYARKGTGLLTNG